MAVEVPENFRAYIDKLSEVSGISISKFSDVIEALRIRHKFFEDQGCKLSDHGIEEFYAEDYTTAEIEAIFNKVYGGTALSKEEILKYKSAMMIEFGIMDAETGWTQQFHYGAIRDNNSKMFRLLGPDTGFDSIGEFTTAKALAKYLDKLNSMGKLAKTILYNLNPADSAVFSTMAVNFAADGAKVQYGAAWWLLDHIRGISEQLDQLMETGLLSGSVGMLTDSRAFTSFVRHEYFRRILCNKLGALVEEGQYPCDIAALGQLVTDICHRNARSYFGF